MQKWFQSKYKEQSSKIIFVEARNTESMSAQILIIKRSKIMMFLTRHSEKYLLVLPAIIVLLLGNISYFLFLLLFLIKNLSHLTEVWIYWIFSRNKFIIISRSKEVIIIILMINNYSYNSFSFWPLINLTSRDLTVFSMNLFYQSHF